MRVRTIKETRGFAVGTVLVTTPEDGAMLIASGVAVQLPDPKKADRMTRSAETVTK